MINPLLADGRVRASAYTPTQVKGLEFDSILLCQPTSALADSANPAHDLYVAMTRPTQRLVVASTMPLPPFLAQAIDANLVE